MAADYKGRQPTGEEVRLWRQAMRDATAYPRARRAIEAALPDEPPPASPWPAAIDVRPVPPPPASPSAPLPDLRPGQTPGVDRRTAQRLRQGDRAIEAVLDLHGLTRAGAHAALRRFLLSSFEAGRRCVLVITGKGSHEGGGVLRAEVPRWLNAEPLRGVILAFVAAQPKHGGSGALYVLLKRQRR